MNKGDFLGGVIEIEAETKKLIKLLNPMPVYISYGDYEIVMASSK